MEKLPVTVRLVLSIDVDGDVYGRTYGAGPYPTDLRSRVREHIINDIRESPAFAEGAIVDVRRVP
jgi:hypothetical protein